LLQVFGDYQLNPFDFENSDRLILITEKRWATLLIPISTNSLTND
jgi:hypothetical protein